MFYNNSTFKIIAFLTLFFLTSYDVESRIVDTIEALQEKKLVINKHPLRLLNLLL